MFVHADVLKAGTVVRLMHPENILSMFVTPDVSTSGMKTRSLLFLNISRRFVTVGSQLFWMFFAYEKSSRTA